jgi:hypothetical protein
MMVPKYDADDSVADDVVVVDDYVDCIRIK